MKNRELRGMKLHTAPGGWIFIRDIDGAKSTIYKNRYEAYRDYEHGTIQFEGEQERTYTARYSNGSTEKFKAKSIQEARGKATFLAPSIYVWLVKLESEVENIEI